MALYIGSIIGDENQVQGISKSLNHCLGFISAFNVGYKRIDCLTLFSLKDKQGCCSCNTEVCQKQGRGGAHSREKGGWISRPLQ